MKASHSATKLIRLIRLVVMGLVIQAGIAEEIPENGDWLRPLSKEKAADEWKVLPMTDVYEVVASKEGAALASGLVESQFVMLTEEVARYFTGSYYRNDHPKITYLVRSVFGHGGTGGYRVYRRGNDLLIEHSSLGGELIYHKSALIINLEFKPEQIHIVCSIGQ